MMKPICTIVSLIFLLVLMNGCSNSGNNKDNTSVKTDRLSGAGASFIFPMMSTWAFEYEKAKGHKVNYQSIGSGAGINQMTAQTVDFGCTDGPMNEEQLKKAQGIKGEVIHIPLAMGAAVPCYNLDEVQETLKLSGPVLADIYLGKITRWNDPALAKLNPGAALPDKEIAVIFRSDGSGTTYIFTDYLGKVSADWKSKVGRGTSVKFPHGTGQNGSDGVASQVKRSSGSIGYVEVTYALQNKIKFAMVQNKEGNFVLGGMESVTAAANAALADIPDDLRYSITDAAGKESYPISGTTWAVTYTDNPGGKGKAVREYLHWCTHDGQQYCEALHYSKLPKGLVERVEKQLEKIK
jgi:phosphate ABC transporter phosphate-binding protein